MPFRLAANLYIIFFLYLCRVILANHTASLLTLGNSNKFDCPRLTAALPRIFNRKLISRLYIL